MSTDQPASDARPEQTPAGAMVSSGEMLPGVLDRTAFERVVADHQQAIHAFLRARLLQASDADDLAQEVFLRFYVARARFDATQMIRPWLLGIARNLLREHARQIRRQKETAWTELCLELEELLPPMAGWYEEAMDHLPECLESLGESARDALRLHYGQGRRLAEIGDRLRRSEGAIKLLIFRARQALKRCLARQMGADGVS
jgi:RNA polymerase sigma-70 factor (ECF subfamily)